jgi:hypothetical protein
VVESQKIQKSTQVFDSKDIVNSTRVGASSNIFDSQDVYKGNKIYRSRAIIESEDLTNCSMIRKGAKLSDSLYCANCENSGNLMFCFDQKGQDYLLFNKPITEEEFESVKEKILSFGAEEVFPTFDFGEFPQYRDTGFNLLTIYFSPEFEAFIKTLPNYDPFIMFKITKNTKYLKEVGPNGQN